MQVDVKHKGLGAGRVDQAREPESDSINTVMQETWQAMLGPNMPCPKSYTATVAYLKHG